MNICRGIHSGHFTPPEFWNLKYLQMQDDDKNIPLR